MDTKEINVHLANDVKTLEILHGDAHENLAPRTVNVSGLIGAPYEFLNKRLRNLHEDESEQVVIIADKLRDCVLVVNRDTRKLSLDFLASYPYGDKVTGQLIMNPDFEKFGINGSGNKRSTFELSDFIKMNASFFKDKNDALKLVSELRNFRAKVDKDMENSDDQRGNRKVKLYQTVESNIPKTFQLSMPVFKGEDPVTFSVEVNIDPSDFNCMLVSPEVKEYIIETRDLLIDNQLNKFESEYPDLAVLEV